ncbi:MAG TPA: hypothetical protein H9814_01110 [Candidatus Bacteroides merdigallinarum]|uniref:Uncharacterized protein n=1 Tax=Candidatus Bacteroides merdigallinarum TaxID=2838473 RepID=A0A9D2J058_9BACE|nr:hypothetical protein [Candidatus Bacteroides merdigallinarum]
MPRYFPGVITRGRLITRRPHLLRLIAPSISRITSIGTGLIGRWLS